MIRFWMLFSICSSVLLNCGQKRTETGENPLAKLAGLKEQVKRLNEEIKNLEAEIAKSDPDALKAMKAKLVTLDTIRQREFKHYIEIQGVVDASQNVFASPQMPGIVSAIYVKEGDYVSSGKLLASLDNTTIRKSIEEVKTTLELAETLFEKQKRLWEQNIGSEAQYLQAKTNKEALEQRLKTMESQLSMSYIRAPVSGVVDEVKMRVGEMVNPGFSGIRVVSGKDLKVKGKLSDSYIGKVKIGARVELQFPDLNQSVLSTISYVGQSVNPNSRTITIEARLPNPNNIYAANQFSKMIINDNTIKNAVVVSSNLIQHSIGGEYYVLVAVSQDNRLVVRKRIVKPGIEYNGETLILEGLHPGDLLITTGYDEIVDGQYVQI